MNSSQKDILFKRLQQEGFVTLAQHKYASCVVESFFENCPYVGFEKSEAYSSMRDKIFAAFLQVEPCQSGEFLARIYQENNFAKKVFDKMLKLSNGEASCQLLKMLTHDNFDDKQGTFCDGGDSKRYPIRSEQPAAHNIPEDPPQCSSAYFTRLVGNRQATATEPQQQHEQ